MAGITDTSHPTSAGLQAHVHGKENEAGKAGSRLLGKSGVPVTDQSGSPAWRGVCLRLLRAWGSRPGRQTDAHPINATILGGVRGRDGWLQRSMMTIDVGLRQRAIKAWAVQLSLPAPGARQAEERGLYKKALPVGQPGLAFLSPLIHSHTSWAAVRMPAPEGRWRDEWRLALNSRSLGASRSFARRLTAGALERTASLGRGGGHVLYLHKLVTSGRANRNRDRYAASLFLTLPLMRPGGSHTRPLPMAHWEYTVGGGQVGAEKMAAVGEPQSTPTPPH